MLNVLKLFRGDLRRLRANVISIIVAIGLVVTPSMFSWFNTLACWNVFNNTGNLKIAVANQDEGYKSDLLPMKVNIGEQVLASLRANNDIDWVFTDAEDARDGAAGGRYYAAVVIPSSFSQDMLDFYSDDIEHADIVYYSNEKKSAIAPRITDKGADSVSYKVNQVFAEILGEVALNIADSLAEYIDSADTTGTLAKISSSISTVADNLDNAATALTLYSSVSNAGGDLARNAQSMTEMAGSAATDASEDLSQAANNGAAFTEKITDSFNDLRQEIDSTKTRLREIEARINEIYETGRNVGDDIHENAQDIINTQNTKIKNTSKTLTQLATQLNEISSSDSLNDQAKIALKKCGDALDKAAASLETATDKIDTATANYDDIYNGLTSFTDDIAAKIATTINELDELDSQIAEFTKSSLSDITQAADALSKRASRIGSKVATTSTDIQSALESIEDALDGTSEKIDEAAQQLTQSATSLRAIQNKITDALQNNDGEALKQLLQADAQDLASALSEPVGIERIAVYSAENFGSAMSPLYSTLGMFIGSLLLMLALKPKASEKTKAALNNPKYWQLFIGRFGIVAVLSLCQTTILSLGNILFLKVQVAHPMLYIICFWLIGLTFAFIVYTLVFSFANLGKALSVLLLVIQVTGSGGSYPLPILPDFVQVISPFLPATHAINAIRAAMFGIYNNDLWVQLSYLLVFFVIFLLIGLVLARPFQKFMKWYVHQAEKSKLIS
jgi:putative membrane protein